MQNVLLDSENKMFYDDRYILDPASSGSLINGVELTVPCIVAVAAPTREQKGIIIAGDPVLNSNNMLYVCWKARRRCSVRHSEGSMLCS